MPDRRGNIKCKDPAKLAAMAAAKAAAPAATANTHSDEEGEIDDSFWAKEDATDERKQADVWSNVKPCSWASQHALPRAAGYRRVGDVYWPAPGDAFAATTLTDAEKREKKERKGKKKREGDNSEDSEEQQAKKKKKKEKEKKTDDL
mmetsp:Transcript_47777/g.114723  ORF Transcript_47777/g.114723 Transcript_47777/m.114723 type:complete len:147 (+) Transcript_47777:138-578(+)